jgi:alpha-ketoglutarate-dependent taurine dioxygenase
MSNQYKKNVLNYKKLIKEYSSLEEIGIKIRQRTILHGFVILQGIEFEFNLESASLFLTELCSNVGILVPHNPGQRDFVWEIKPQNSKSSLKTFSEHNQYAPLHTDSQYRNHPERFIALMTINQARCGGGYTNLLDFQKAFHHINHTVSGREIINFMANQYFPIAIPSIFQPKNEKKYISAKLIAKMPFIRYRYDTLQAGLSLIKDSKFEVFQKNLEKFDRLIEESPHRVSFLSSTNEIVFIDNYRLLHGRSSFLDLNRLLLRTRMN